MSYKLMRMCTCDGEDCSQAIILQGEDDQLTTAGWKEFQSGLKRLHLCPICLKDGKIPVSLDPQNPKMV